jgi:hypothetical protein
MTAFDLPTSWATALKNAYPSRSGVNNWGSLRLMLALRSALQSTPWKEIIDGCERYKSYCAQAGIAGTIYVQSPLRFIEGQGYLEDFRYQPPPSRIELERRQVAARDADRLAQARAAGGRFDPPLEPYAGESVAAYETRIYRATHSPERRQSVHGDAALDERLHRLTGKLTQ